MPWNGIYELGAWTVLAAAALIDVSHGRIPNPLTGAAALTALALRMASGGLAGPATAALVAAGALLGVRVLGLILLRTPGMGMGDVKLAGALGLWLGWRVLWIVYLAAVLGGGWSAAGLLAGRLKRNHRLPFAPFLAAAALVEAALLPFEAVLYVLR